MRVKNGRLSENGCRELPKAVVFDFDGVILESADIKTGAFLDLFADYPEHREAILRYHLDNLGISRYRKFEWIYSELLDKPLDEDERRHLGETFSNIVMQEVLQCAFVPGAVKCLESLLSKSMLFVASGTPQAELETIIERRGLTQFFTEVWGTPLGKTEIIRSILIRFDLRPAEALFIGDGVSDYRAAEETGVSFLAREAGHVGIDWARLGATAFPDLAGILAHLQDAPSQEGS